MSQTMLSAFGLQQGAVSHQNWYVLHRENTSQELIFFIMSDNWQAITKVEYDISSDININSAPTVDNSLTDLSVDIGSAVSIDFSNTFADVNAADQLLYTATLADNSPLPDWLVLNTDTKTITGTCPSTVQTLEIKISVTDLAGASISENVQVSVIEPNAAPTVVNPVADQSVNINTAVTFDFSNTFADANAGDLLSFTATLSDGSALPAWLVFNTSNKQISGITPSLADTLQLKITATDLLGLSVSDEAQLIIIDNSGIEPFNFGNIAITPNPAKDKVKIVLGNNSVNVFLSVSDTKGNTIISNQEVITNKIIDVNNWASGVYNFTFKSEGKTITKKIVVE